MTLDKRLQAWSTGLLAEIFGDTDGDGRPVTVILVNEEVLSRAAARAGITLHAPACDAFVSAFPGRDAMASWFGNGDLPDGCLVAFLMLCCFAAGEAADLDANDYRQRLAELFRWDEPIITCNALPSLWRKLEKLVRTGRDLRPFKLPDPTDYRSIIGHAIELAFPARPDATKLRTILANHAVDSTRPADVLVLLEREIPRHNFTASFRDAFRAFKAAWRAGHRALADDRFWVGWRMIAKAEVEPSEDALIVMADEYGAFRLTDDDDRPLNLFDGVRRRDFTRELMNLVEARKPLFLADAGWRRWRLAGDDSKGRRRATAALIWDKAFARGRLEQFGGQPVAGAQGWSFTTALDVLLGIEERRGSVDDSFFNPIVGGVARIDGGYLCRPSFPLTIRADLAIGSVILRGDDTGPAMIVLTAGQARVSFPPGVSADLTADIESRTTGDVVLRAVRPRSSALAPGFKDPPARLVPDEEVMLSGWLPTTDARPLGGRPSATGGDVTNPKVLDLIELLACRTGATQFSGLLEFLEDTLDLQPSHAWDLIRAFEEAGALRVLRNKGWGGRALIPARPRAILAATEAGWSMRVEGVANETLISRLAGAADRRELDFKMTPGVTEWAVPTAAVASPDLESLTDVASDLELETTYVVDNLAFVPTLVRARPNADGRNHPERTRMPLPTDVAQLGAELYLCKRENNDAPRLWLVSVPNAEDRYWSTRNDALLDIHLTTGVPAFRFDGELVRASPFGCRLPLNLARWLRLATGVAGGPMKEGYAYAAPSCTVRFLHRCLGPLLEREPAIATAGDPMRGRTRSLGIVMATNPATGGTATIEPWRRARALGRH
jgi:hypothetical protein